MRQQVRQQVRQLMMVYRSVRELSYRLQTNRLSVSYFRSEDRLNRSRNCFVRYLTFRVDILTLSLYCPTHLPLHSEPYGRHTINNWNNWEIKGNQKWPNGYNGAKGRVLTDLTFSPES